MPPRLKILLSAYACEPGKGSEPEVGWQWAVHLAHHHDICVLTRSNNRPAIEKNRPQNLPESSLQFLYYDLPRPFLAAKRWGLLPVPIFYALWQWGACLRLKPRLGRFDLVHHLTFNSFLLPGFWPLFHPRTVAGPLGGGMTAPWRLLKWFGPTAWKEALRTVAVNFASANPLQNLLLRRLRLAIAANRDTEKRIAGKTAQCVRFLETAIIPSTFNPAEQKTMPASVSLLWFSRAEPRKGLMLALAGFHEARKLGVEARFRIAGTGPEIFRARKFARDAHLEPWIDWLGKVSRENVPDLYRQADIFVFTSLRDTSGNVLLEAMASGLPVITLAHQGADEIATDESALKISTADAATLPFRLGQAMHALAQDTSRRRRLGQKGFERIQAVFSWPCKAKELSRWYERIVF